MNKSGWRLDKINSMRIFFYKTGELKGSSYVKIPMRRSAILNSENNDNNCFIRSNVAHVYPCNHNHPNKSSNYKHCFNEFLDLISQRDLNVVMFIVLTK